MEITELLSKIGEYLEKLYEPENYKKYLFRYNRLNRFNTIQRLAILSQSEGNCFDAMTEQEWFSCGRELKHKHKEIYIPIPQYSIEYVDSETKESVADEGMQPDELAMGVKYGILEQRVQVGDLSCYAVYDIRDTRKIKTEAEENGSEQQEQQVYPDTTLSNIIRVLKDTFGITVECSSSSEDSEPYFYRKKNTLILPKLKIEETREILSELLVDSIVAGLNGEKSDNEAESKLIKIGSYYSVVSLFGSNTDKYDTEIAATISGVDDISKVVADTDTVVSIAIELLYEGNKDSGTADRIYKTRVAEVMCSIVDALLVRLKLE